MPLINLFIISSFPNLITGGFTSIALEIYCHFISSTTIFKTVWSMP